MKRQWLPVVALLLLLCVSCGKTVESKKQAWDDSLAKIKALAIEFPSFKGVIDEQIKIAQPVRDAVETTSGTEAKIAKLEEAIGLLNAPFLRKLEEFRTLRQSTKDKIVKVRSANMEPNERAGADQAIWNAETAIRQAEMKLSGATVTDKAGAEGLANLVLSDLKATQPSLDQVADAVKAREKSTQQKVDQDKAEKEKADKAKEPVKCEYCGNMNQPGTGKCKSCGAALSR